LPSSKQQKWNNCSMKTAIVIVIVMMMIVIVMVIAV
jgi:uncharacterized membrane protein YvbJ